MTVLAALKPQLQQAIVHMERMVQLKESEVIHANLHFSKPGLLRPHGVPVEGFSYLSFILSCI